MKNSSRTTVLLLLMAILTGCSWFGKDEPEYLDSVEGEPLQIPEGLDSPIGARPVVISAPKMRTPTGDELEPMPPRVVSTAGKQDTNTFMAWSAEGVYLMVKDSPESVARRLRFAIERSGMNLLERDDTGAHKFQYRHERISEDGFFKKMMFWRDGPADYSGTYRTGLSADGEETRVYLFYPDGRSCDTQAAEVVLGVFMERLG
jgi:uncharacterized lipoprotein